MECPYCVTDIPQHALVCPRCARDLYLFKPLLAKIAALESTLSEVSSRQLEAFEGRLASLEKQLESAAPVPAMEAPATAVASVPPAPAIPANWQATQLTSILAAMVSLLIAAHYVMLFMYDLRPLYLRIASILLPLLFGLAWQRLRPKALAGGALAGFIAAGLAALGMMFVTSRIDGVPLIPQEAHEAREVFEYVMSMGLAFVTGLLLGGLLGRVGSNLPGKLSRVIAVVLSDENDTGIEKLAARIHRFGSSISPVVTAAASIYTGVKVLMN